MPNVLQTDMFYEVCSNHCAVVLPFQLKAHVVPYMSCLPASGCWPIMLHWHDILVGADEVSTMQPHSVWLTPIGSKHFMLCFLQS